MSLRTPPLSIRPYGNLLNPVMARISHYSIHSKKPTLDPEPKKAHIRVLNRSKRPVSRPLGCRAASGEPVFGGLLQNQQSTCRVWGLGVRLWGFGFRVSGAFSGWQVVITIMAAANLQSLRCHAIGSSSNNSHGSPNQKLTSPRQDRECNADTKKRKQQIHDQ